MTFTQIDIPEIAKPGHKVGDQGHGDKQFAQLQPTPGDKSFNASWNEMQLSKMSPQSLQHVVNGLTLFTSKEQNPSKTDAHGLKENLVAFGLPDLGKSAIFTELKETVRDAGKQLDKNPQSDRQANEEVHKNPDGSVVHKVDGKVTEVDYPNGGRATFKYGPDGKTVEEVVWERPDHSKATIRRRHPDGENGTLRYDVTETDPDGKVTRRQGPLRNSVVNVRPDGTFTLGCYNEDENGGNEHYVYFKFATDGSEPADDKSGDPPPAGA
jgi:hypothetical protein